MTDRATMLAAAHVILKMLKPALQEVNAMCAGVAGLQAIASARRWSL